MKETRFMYWDKEKETISREDLKALQVARIRESVERATSSHFYGRLFRKLGVNEGMITSPDDIRRLPFTTKDDLREHWPYGFLAVPKEELVRMHSSSGTTGRATVIFHTQKDINEWTSLVARSMYMTGVRKGDVFQNMMTYGLFTGGLGFHYGGERIGVLVIPAGAGNSKRQIQLMSQPGAPSVELLTKREKQILTLIARGKTSRCIAEELSISRFTVENHRANMMRKLGLNNAVSLLRFALEKGLA